MKSVEEPLRIQTEWQSSHFRRSVERDVKRWVGWPEIEEKRRAIAEEGPELEGVYMGTFATGGRITEVLHLQRSNFRFEEGFAEVREMKLEKHFAKKGGYIEQVAELPDNVLRRLFSWNQEKGLWERRRYSTEKDLNAVRLDFTYPLSEPMAADFQEFVESKEGYLFPSRTKPSVLMHRSFVYRKFIKHGVYPHWLRSQRASCLRSVYRFRLEDLLDWFSWLDLRTAKHYALMGTEDQRKRFLEAMSAS
jgi:integrase